MKISVYVGTSLDGFIARKDGDIDWLTPYASEEVVDAYNRYMTRIDGIVLGKGTYEKVLTFPSWPYEKKAFLLSTTIKHIPADLSDKVTLLSMEPKALLGHLSNMGLNRLYIDGGKVIQSFLKEDLVDELIISRVPVLIGSGIPLFDFIDADLHFKHVRTETASNGLVRSYYEREKK